MAASFDDTGVSSSPRGPPALSLGKTPVFSSQPQDSSSRKTTLQRRVQNALRWKSWGGEQTSSIPSTSRSGSMTEEADWAAPSAEPNQQRHRIGNSIGSDVELSSFAGAALPLRRDRSSADAAPGSPSETTKSLRPGGVSAKSSAGSYAGHNNDNSNASTSANAGSAPLSPSHAAGSSAVDILSDMCSVATQAGSRAHSFTSLYSMMTDQGDQTLDMVLSAQALGASSPPLAASSRDGSSSHSFGHAIATAMTAGAPAAASGPQSAGNPSYRGSDTAADEKASVSTLPLISETAYDEEQKLDDVQHLAEEQNAAVQGFTEDQDDYNPLKSIAGRPRVSSSHGSITSSTSDVSAAAPPGGSGELRFPGSGHGLHSRSAHASTRTSGRSLHGHQQQQQQLHLQDDGLPLPFSTRKRPESDETCSYATQAGSVHSVSSIMSSAFIDSSTPQRHTAYSAAGDSAASGSLRLSGPSGQYQQQYPIHPLSEPDEIEYHDNLSNQDDVDVSDFTIPNGVSVVPAGAAIPATTVATAAAEGSGGLGDTRHKGRKRTDTDRHSDKGVTLKGALKSVVAWGSGLGQRLQRVGSNVVQQQGSSGAAGRQEQTGVQGASGGAPHRAQIGPSSSQELANF